MFEAELNEPQAEAVAHVNGPLLVFAGAGSGKTRVITYRIANLVACARVPPYRILAVTFTNKAAGEMRHRTGTLLGADLAKDLWVGTFHATCAKLLRSHGHAIGLPRSFLIYDPTDQKAVVNRVLKELDLDEKRYPPRQMLEWIMKHKQEGRGPDDVSVDSYIDEQGLKIYRAYQKQLQDAGAADFEDLILLVSRLLEKDPGGEGEKIRRRFEYVLVDEFQDTNATQYKLLRELTKKHRNLCVVGDDDQSIYRWRGADVRNIRGFKKDFPEAQVVKLEQNYRSTSNIVRAALGVISPSIQREPKELWTENDDGAPVDIVACRDERAEAALVVKTVQAARSEGIDLRQIAVFYRIHAQSRVLEEAMRSVNIPYQIVGGMKFYERAEIKDALSYLRVIVNSKSDVDVLRIINTPARGIGATTVDKLTSFAVFRSAAVFDALEAVGEIGDLANAAKKKLGAFRDLILDLRAEAERLSPSELLDLVLDKSGYRAALNQDDSAEAEGRMENLEELKGSLMDFETEMVAAGETATIDGFLERVTLQAGTDDVEDSGKVTLMTVHGAKGLEFELVLLTGMEEEMFPYRGLDPGGQEELEEERRLAYVAVTRARQKLICTHVSTRQIFGTTRFGMPSRFLSDIPREVTSRRTTALVAERAPRFTERPSPWQEQQPRSGPWRHPQQARSEPPSSGRYVDREFFQDDPGDGGSDVPIRRGSRVVHARFGEGEVRRIESSPEPSVVAFFPGWGEKKILARFLKLA
jgi:DNA helicase-2/ATP-dependent DNA helicase PcrA